MAKTQKKAPARAGEEWIASRFPMQTQVIDGGERFQPDVALWLSGDGLILATEICRPAESAAAVGTTLRAALTQPLDGAPRRPTSIRVSDPALVAPIRAVIGADVAIHVAPTPEVDQVAALMAKMPMGGGEMTADDFYGPGLSEERLAGFHRAAARLFRAAPWEIVPDDAYLFGLGVPSRGVRDACLSVIGQMGESLAVLFFPNIEAYLTFRRVCEEANGGPPAADLGVPVFSINFESAADIPPALPERIKERRWEVAGPRAYPVISYLDPDGTMRPLGDDDVTLAWICCEALTRFVTTHGERIEELEEVPAERYRLDEVPGAPEVEMVAPHPRAAEHGLVAELDEDEGAEGFAAMLDLLASSRPEKKAPEKKAPAKAARGKGPAKPKPRR